MSDPRRPNRSIDSSTGPGESGAPPGSNDLAALLRELDQQQRQQGMPIGTRNRVALAIRDHEAKRRAAWRRWLPAASFAAGAALVLAVIGTQWGGASSGPSSSSPLAVAVAPTARLGTFSVHGSECRSRPVADSDATALGGDCRLVADHMTVQVWEHAEVSAESDAFVVHEGSVLFEVEKVRDPNAPVRVRVSHGAIEVVGTRFAVEQDAEGGHVDLLEGKIRFHEPDGSVVDILPGQRHAWGDQRSAPLAVADVVPAPSDEDDTIEIVDDDELDAASKRSKSIGSRRDRTQPRAEARAAALIERVTDLRAQKRYRAAADELRAALRRKWDRRTSQVLSYELGEILRSSSDTEGACRHFAAHQRKYPRGRYHAAIERVMERLRCASE